MIWLYSGDIMEVIDFLIRYTIAWVIIVGVWEFCRYIFNWRGLRERLRENKEMQKHEMRNLWERIERRI